MGHRSMKRYIAQFHKGGFPELYHVAERVDGQWVRVGEPKPYHAANDEAEARNNGTFAIPQTIEGEWSVSAAFTNWLGGTSFPP